MKKRIYLDHAAATYLDGRVKKAMDVVAVKNYGNPSSLHKEGREAREVVEKSRAEIAKIIGARPEEIIFTSGGTEGDNLAIFGVINSLANLAVEPPSSHGGSTAKWIPHIITTKIEHHAVLYVCRKLEREGVKVDYAGVNEDGIVDPQEIKRLLRPETVLVSVMHANNEVGTIQPIAEIAKVIKEFSKVTSSKFQVPSFHTDACQSAGYLDLDVNKLGVDLMTVNGGKMYGPKGVGFLYVRKGTQIKPMIYGGGQERKMRAGTENVAGIVGLAEALKIADKEKIKESKRLTDLRDYFIKQILTKIPKSFLNGSEKERLPNNVNVSILGVEGEAMVLYLDEAGIACSTGSACTSESLEPSHVIMALGKPVEYGHGSLRFTLGRKTTKQEVDYTVKVLQKIVEKLRSFSAI